MHIPDNYLSPLTCAAMGAAMVPVWAVSVKKVKQELTSAKIPMLGIGAAFSFLLMMFNVPLPGGTTGHAVGGTLIAVLIGPFAACIAVTVALLLQALLFGDGGILAFGANCFNMAFVLPFLGYAVYSLFKAQAKTPKGELVGIAVIVFVPSAWRWVGLVGVVLLATTFVNVCPIYLALGIRTNKKDK